MTLFLKQTPKAIHFGAPEHFHKLSTERIGHFKAEDVTAARDDLAERYPDDIETIDRYAARLMEMV